jgi:hypothetical protein
MVATTAEPTAGRIRVQFVDLCEVQPLRRAKRGVRLPQRGRTTASAVRGTSEANRLRVSSNRFDPWHYPRTLW